MAHYIYLKTRLVEGAPSYAVHFVLKNLGGTPQTGQIASMDIWRARLRESPATQIVSSGVGVGSQSLVEVDSTNMPGVYELELDTADISTPGPLTLWIESAGAEETVIHCEVLSRSGAF